MAEPLKYEFRFVFTGGAPAAVHVHIPPDIDTGAILAAIKEMSTKMAVDLSALSVAVANATTVSDSAVVLINQIAEQLRTMSTNNVDPAELAALADSLTRESAELAQAVTANTPAVEPVDPNAPVDPNPPVDPNGPQP